MSAGPAPALVLAMMLMGGSASGSLAQPVGGPPRLSDARFHSGEFNKIIDLKEGRDVVRSFQGKLRAMGVVATVVDCADIGFVAAASASGERAYGAQCRVRIGRRPPAPYWLCKSEMTGFYIAQEAPEDVPSTEAFIRRTCW